ncbi:MAG: tRNA (adenosine(37)-N6)-threonylcarbamoyltransferase complex ATPase subunit type 1 TsaE [Eubacteriales bacterium]|nr:tRNA (adenosine(37)-N6)-threonylcarbamoyltransferase complex ATPase subunit type 1 TsaE [Eubacteriales bacterium]
MTIYSGSAAQTQRLGALLAKQLQPGDVLILQGDMGAGKSELTRGIARGLGIAGYITSPTFTILQVHEGGRLKLYHFDWYRLADPEELYELSMDEYLYGDGVSVVEWPVKAAEVLPADYLEITLQPTGETDREIVFRPVGNFRALDFQPLSEVSV